MSFMSEPRALQFVDTNILIYAHDRSAGDKHICARDLVRALWQSGEGCLSIQVLQEFYVNVTQKVAKPLTPDAAAQIIVDLSAWQVHRPGVEDVLDAIRLQGRYQISFWDAMIVASAIQLGCHTIWSEDLSPGQAYDSVTVTSPYSQAAL
jgi:predicted nucleic acid-binding protein